MKTLVAALALCIVGFNAHAGNPTLPVALPEIYTLKTIEVAQDSVLLPQNIGRADLMIDKEERLVRIVIQQPWSCPVGAMCAMVMPEPVVIELPITYMGVPFCGGRVIVAEENKLPADGMLKRIEILDNNGSNCNGPDPKFEPMQLTLLEVFPRNPDAPIASTMVAVPYRK